MNPLLEAREGLSRGRFAEAEAALRRFITANPASPEALELLGACLGAQGRHGEALEAIDSALQLRPAASPAVLYNRAQALLNLGRWDDARSVLEGLLAARADSVQAWVALARAHAGAGSREEAIAAYRRALALQPQLAPAHNDLANLLRMGGATRDALTHYAEAVRLAPAMPEALSNYGSLLREEGRVGEALPLLERAFQLQPRSPSLLNNLGVAYYDLSRYADAERCYRQAIEIDPRIDEFHVNLANALAAQGRFEEALPSYRLVIARSPANADAYSNLGMALHDLDRVDEAREAYLEALRLAPDHPVALNNLGFVLEQTGRRAEAKALYRRTLEVKPGLARARYNLALNCLADFEFAEGWKLSDESRFDVVPPIAVRRDFGLPPFAGDWGDVRRLAVWAEQGVGDQILCSTVLPDVEARGVPFVLEADARLLPAFRRAHPQWQVVARAEAAGAFRSCDRQVPVGSLPRWLRPTRESFASQPRALLRADEGRSAAYRRELASPGRRVIAISWRSFQPKSRAPIERRKSAPLAAFRALSLRDDVKLVDLQYGDTAPEREQFAAGGGRLTRVEGLDLFNDLDGVLAAIEACDLVVTTSNVTAHLAAAIGKETWLVYLSGVPSFFYWSADEAGRCLWYPSVRILTGSGRETWNDLLQRVDRRLDERTG